MHSEPQLAPGRRYGAALLLTLVAVVFFVIAPDDPWSRAVGLLLTLATLLVAVVLGRGTAVARGTAATAATVVGVGVASAVLLESLQPWVASALGGVIVISTIAMLVVGLARLLRERGVTIQAVTGALAVYLLLGLLFALVVGVAAHATAGPYFAQGTDGSQSENVYYSFTTMTTTGYGDLTPATSLGRGIAVVAMLIGQIYLVTVIAMLVGNLGRRRRA